MRQTGDAWRPSPNSHTIKIALHYPDLALLFLTRRKSYEEVVATMVQRDLASLRRRAASLEEGSDSFLRLTTERKQQMIGRIIPAGRRDSSLVFNEFYGMLYAATRAFRPRRVVETGVYMGASSAAILQALHSIDLPTSQHRYFLQEGKSIQIGLPSPSLSVGFAVPHTLRRRWDLHLGSSLDVLPDLLQELGPISMFIHDSLHTYEHMTAEFTLGYNALEKGGVLIADDIGYNRAWADFCNANHEQGEVLTNGPGFMGCLVKSH